jgi:hypothetical protein
MFIIGLLKSFGECTMDKSSESSAFHGGWNSVGDEGAAGSLEDGPNSHNMFITCLQQGY